MSSEIDHFLLNQIKRHEGFRKHVYQCTAGYNTIGIGRNLDSVGITENEAEYLLNNDLQEAVKMARSLNCYKKLSRRRKQVLINMIFNIGLPRLKGFKKFLKALDDEDYPLAAFEMLDSKWATQVGNRAIELSEQMKEG